jgi:electron transfer flavoprotein beta subunit
MKIVVCVKQVGALDDEIEFTGDGLAIDPDFLEPLLNEWDAYAMEEGLRLREAAGGEVVVVTCGGEDAEPVLRRCLAMGADRAIRIEADLPIDALAPAHALAETVREEQPELVLCGAQSADEANGATPAALAALLQVPCVAVARKIEPDGAERLVVHRELEGGLIDVLELDLPAVVSVQTGINTPRYAALRAIRQAEEHEIVLRRPELPDSKAQIRELRLPAHVGSTSMLEGDAAEIARQISVLVKERLT